jgi:hypothetical protein
MGSHMPVHLILFALSSLTLIWGVGSIRKIQGLYLIDGPGCELFGDIEWNLIAWGRISFLLMST